MKKIFLLFVMLICGISINAQVTVSEPEFADETLLLTSNGQGVTALSFKNELNT